MLNIRLRLSLVGPQYPVDSQLNVLLFGCTPTMVEERSKIVIKGMLPSCLVGCRFVVQITDDGPYSLEGGPRVRQLYFRETFDNPTKLLVSLHISVEVRK